MRGDGSWNEVAKMSSFQGLPAQGSETSILITRVQALPMCELVEFWAKFNQERAADYLSMAKNIQSPGNLFKEFEGNLGDLCLAQKDGVWYRARFVSRNGPQHIVFLIDKGLTYSTIQTMLAWGRKEYFNLPPEVEFCVLANVLPVSPDNRWSPVALEFLKSLTGRSVKVRVQDVVMQHRMFVLHIPCIAQQIHEVGFARMVPPGMFQDFLLASLQCKHGPVLPEEPQSVFSFGKGERLLKETFLYPELQAGTVETVVVTEVTSPQRIFCQLKVFSQELKKLSDQLTQCCDGRTAACTISPEMIGFPCAAQGSDGKWYRSVLQQVFPSNKVVEVLNVDYGVKQIVQMENVRPLASEFFRMPVVTYSCSLHGILDKGVGWTTAQIDYLRTLLLSKTIIAKFEYQSIIEGVYYVTLYGDENSNISNVFGSKESCLLHSEKTLGHFGIPTSGHSHNKTSAQQKRMGRRTEEDENRLPVEDLPIKSTHVAFVQYVASPSDFWIQTQNLTNELEALMDKMANLYQNDLKDYVVKNPTVGLYCAAKAEDGEYYRATVTEVRSTKVTVHFVDYGNNEAVEKCFIKTLPDELKKLPLLALKCTLADVRPKAGEWCKEACELFTKTVMDRALNVHVLNKFDSCHFVQLTYPEAQREKDMAKLLCTTGFAVKDETMRQSKVKTSSWSSPPSMATSFQPQYPLSRDIKPATFKEQMFSIGSVLDVNVSYIESPNDFWCQLVQSAEHLKLLMYDMQTHYRNSEFQPLVRTACVARHPENGMWYRALIVHKHETPHVDVLFIDYGQTETVNVLDLRKIEKDFLTLPGQAFRCSLINPVDPTSAINNWTEEAVDRFLTFVETAANNFVILKCTIYAVMYSERKILFNIVNLETPFESISTSLVNLIKSAPPNVPSGPSFRLDTYYYSTHNVKTGTEEQVTVTSVKNISHFYCQLKRNADVLEDLQLKVANLCEQLLTVKVPPVFGTLCFAKYTDGQWYRGQIIATKPSVLVQFVDYGDTIEVDKADMLPIPKEASDIMTVPVQAILCSLSDVPDNVPQEANSWFETSSTECEFRALVVAKEPDGKLVVELYQGKVQVNSKIKKLFDVEMHTEKIICQYRKRCEPTVKLTQKMEKFDSMDKKIQSIPKCHQNVKGNQQLYTPPHQRQSNGKLANEPKYKEQDNAKQNGTPKYTKQKDRTPLIQTKPYKHKNRQHTLSPATESWISDSAVPQPQKLPNLADLPSKSIKCGMVTDVYISHCNSPLSFFVQFVKEEDDIFSIVEKLNDPETSSKSDIITEVHPGDLVQAEFPNDSSWYRAVVKEKQDKATVLVEFVDFGNTASVPLSKMGKMDKSFLTLPVYSTHCLLKSAASLAKVMDPEIVSAFESAIGNLGEKQFKCKFIQQSGTVWEVSLQYNGVEVECKPTSMKSQSDTTRSQVKKVPSKAEMTESCLLKFKQKDFQKGQTLEVYIAAITDAQTFWCQSTDTEELDQISESLVKAGDTADAKNLDSLSVGSPCIALFSEDQLWYRAEVLNKTRDEVSLLFVDYGNTSQVKLSDVRQIPPQLVQNSVQAFLCELEGFDSSKGSWESRAADELSALTADQLLQLTVTKVTKESGKTKCYVHLECEGQVINESMRVFWKSAGSKGFLKETQISTQPLSEIEAEAPTENLTCEVSASLSQDSNESFEVLTVNQIDTTAFKSLDFKDPSEFLIEDDEKLVLADDTQVGQESSCMSFFMTLGEDEYQMCSTSSGSQILENLEVNISAITTEPSDYSTSDLAMEETVFYCTGDETEDLSSSYAARLRDQEDQDLSVLDSTGPENMGSLLDGCFLEAIHKFDLTDNPFGTPYKEAGDGLDTCKYADPNQDPNSPETVILKVCSPIVKRAARLVPCLDLNLGGKIKEQETPDYQSRDSLQYQNESKSDLFLVPSNYVLPSDSFDQDTETSEMVVPHTPCSASVTSAQMVPRLAFNLMDKTSPEQGIPEESQQNSDVILWSFVPSQESFDSNRDTESPEVVVSEKVCSSMTSDIKQKEALFLPSRDVLPQDSSDQDIATSELAVPEILSSVTLGKTNEDLLPSNDVTPHDSHGLDQNTENEQTSVSVTPEQMYEDLLLPVNVALPHDSFDSDQDQTPGVVSETPPAYGATDTMNQDLLLLPANDVSPQDSIEQEFFSEAEGNALCPNSKDETTDGKTDLLSELLANCKETCSDLFGAGDAADIESQTFSEISAEKGDAAEEATFFPEVSLLDFCSEENCQIENLSVSEASSDPLRIVTEEETVDKCPPSVQVPCGQLIVFDDVETGVEPESSFSSLSYFPEMAALIEQMSLEEEASTADPCAGEELATESESSNSLEDGLLKQMEQDSSDDTQESFADDSLEAQLFKVTHLSLIVNDGDALEHPPEE